MSLQFPLLPFGCRVIVLVVLAAGCGKDEVPSPDTGTDVRFAGPDFAAPDATSADVTPTTDMSMHADAGPDAMSNDMPATDTTNGDTSSSPACAPGFTSHEEIAGTVVACAGAADALTQCDAATACGTGWHMCTATEYRSFFESVEPTSVADGTYWIASCIRDGADAVPPSDAPCSDCTGTQTGSDATVSFSCVNPISIDSDQLYVGVRAASACTFAGVDAPGNDAFWNAQPASTPQTGAFCCAD